MYQISDTKHNEMENYRYMQEKIEKTKRKSKILRETEGTADN